MRLTIPNKAQENSASAARLFVHCLRRVSLGSVRRLGPRRFHRQTAAGTARCTPSIPLILSQTRTTFSLLVLLADPRLCKGLAAHQAAGARSGVLLPSGNAWSRGFELFLLRGHSKNQCRHRHHRAVHRSSLGSVLRRRPPPAKAHAQKVAAVALAVTGIALVINLFGARRATTRFAWIAYGLIAALLASFSFAFYNVAGHGILARYDRWRVLVWTLAAAASLLARRQPSMEDRCRSLRTARNGCFCSSSR